MQTLGGLGLLAALTICYVLYFRSQPASVDNGADDSRPIAAAYAPQRGPTDLQTASAPPHSVYKADLDRAHAAARQIQAAHAETDAD